MRVEIENDSRAILIVTPEKLHYVLRHQPELVDSLDLMIFDEGHLFDDPSRGVNYELLLSHIKTRLPTVSQIVLISAVIKNATQVAAWLVGSADRVVSGANMTPTARSIAFPSWETTLGQLQFPMLRKQSQDFDFFVPRLIEQLTLSTKSKFPDRRKPNDVALYLGLRLAAAGTVAVFFGRKDSAFNGCERYAQLLDKGLDFDSFGVSHDAAEVSRLSFLMEQHFGADSPLTRTTALGILSHHGSIPHGIRIAVEFALQTSRAKIVLCTSTLAQGVNLPIRYLIVSSVYQGRERIKVRDFHNLIGRAGRAGSYTEGSIIFSDPEIYDNRHSDSWRWRQANELLDPSNSESCISAISTVLAPVYNDLATRAISTDPIGLALSILDDDTFLDRYATTIFARPGFSEDRVRQQLGEKRQAIQAIQSYLLANSEGLLSDPNSLDTLAEATLAYSLANEQDAVILKKLFRAILDNIQQKVPVSERRAVYGRTLLGLSDCVAIDAWVSENMDILQQSPDEDALFTLLWPTLSGFIRNSIFRRCNPRALTDTLVLRWLDGSSFKSMHENDLQDAKLGFGARPRRFTIANLVDLCENAFGYDGTLVLGAIAELSAVSDEGPSALLAQPSLLQKRLKYGLPSPHSVVLFELGFSDRHIAMHLASLLPRSARTREEAVSVITENYAVFESALRQYPSYFTTVLERTLK